MKNNQIKNFENVFNELDKSRYNSIQLEIKRNFQIKRKIRINDQHKSWNLVLNYISPKEKIENGYFCIKNKVCKIIEYKEFNKIEFQQVFKEFILNTKIVFKSNKVIFSNYFKHIFPLTIDSAKGLIIKKVLIKDFKRRYKEMKGLLK